mgnify:CR=1 FL=1
MTFGETLPADLRDLAARDGRAAEFLKDQWKKILNIDIKKAPDTTLYVPGWALVTIAGVFILLLPLGLLGYGVGRWVVRRRK